MVHHVNMPLFVWDRKYIREQKKKEPSEYLLASPYEWVQVEHTEDYADGPTNSRVAVGSFNPESGSFTIGATKFIPQGVGRTVSCYDVELADIDDEDALLKSLESDSFINVNAFATVMKTISFFESSDALGRRITWAFDSPQLYVIPQAGLDENAYYDRDSHSLRFFYFPSRLGYNVYTALSHDIIVHEASHAILDGVAPYLISATSTESVAIHEAVADLAAIFLTLLNEMVIFSFYALSSSQMDIGAALSKVAEEFGSEARDNVGVDYVRVLKNRRILKPESVNLTDPYEVSEVLSGAVYKVFTNSVSHYTLEDTNDIGVSINNLLKTARIFSRMVFRALDYLPPGEASLADFCRAMMAAHIAVFSKMKKEMRLLVHELIERKIISNEDELSQDPDTIGKVIGDADCRDLLEKDVSAGLFADKQRDLLRIPLGADFEVLPRIVRTRVQGSDKKRVKQDLIIKVIWDALEEHDLGPLFGSDWGFTAGTTLVLDWDTRRILSVLTTDQGKTQRNDRNRRLRMWVNKGVLLTQEDEVTLGNSSKKEVIVAKNTGKMVKAVGMARIR